MTIMMLMMLITINKYSLSLVPYDDIIICDVEMFPNGGTRVLLIFCESPSLSSHLFSVMENSKLIVGRKRIKLLFSNLRVVAKEKGSF